MLLLLQLRELLGAPQQVQLWLPTGPGKLDLRPLPTGSALSMALRDRRARLPLAIRSRRRTPKAHFRMGPRGNVFVASAQGHLRLPHISRGHKSWQSHQAATCQSCWFCVGSASRIPSPSCYRRSLRTPRCGIARLDIFVAGLQGQLGLLPIPRGYQALQAHQAAA